MAEKINIMVVEPGKAPCMVRSQNTVEAFGKIVGGPIEVGCYLPEKVILIRNEDAAQQGQPPNRANPRGREFIFGTFLLCGFGENFASLTPEQAATFQAYFAKPCELMLLGTDKVYAALTDMAMAAQSLLESVRNGEAVVVNKTGGDVYGGTEQEAYA